MNEKINRSFMDDLKVAKDPELQKTITAVVSFMDRKSILNREKWLEPLHLFIVDRRMSWVRAYADLLKSIFDKNLSYAELIFFSKLLPDSVINFSASRGAHQIAMLNRVLRFAPELVDPLITGLKKGLILCSNEGLSLFVDKGEDVFKEDHEKGIKWFRMQSRKARSLAASCAIGVALPDIVDDLLQYVRISSGCLLKIVLIDKGHSTSHCTVLQKLGFPSAGQHASFTDGKTLYLPEVMDEKNDKAENEIRYRITARLLAGYVEYGSTVIDYHWIIQQIKEQRTVYSKDMEPDEGRGYSTLEKPGVRRWDIIGYSAEVIDGLEKAVLAAETPAEVCQCFFSHVPQSHVVQNLFVLLEDVRMISCLFKDYKGLANRYRSLLQEEIKEMGVRLEQNLSPSDQNPYGEKMPCCETVLYFMFYSELMTVLCAVELSEKPFELLLNGRSRSPAQKSHETLVHWSCWFKKEVAQQNDPEISLLAAILLSPLLVKWSSTHYRINLDAVTSQLSPLAFKRTFHPFLSFAINLNTKGYDDAIMAEKSVVAIRNILHGAWDEMLDRADDCSKNALNRHIENRKLGDGGSHGSLTSLSLTAPFPMDDLRSVFNSRRENAASDALISAISGVIKPHIALNLTGIDADHSIEDRLYNDLLLRIEKPVQQFVIHHNPDSTTEKKSEASSSRDAEIRYHEWDDISRDYLESHTRIMEMTAVSGDEALYRAIMSANAGLLTRVKNAFEKIKPQNLTLIPHCIDGEEFDYRSLLNAVIDRRTGHPPDDRIYSRRMKNRREVAVLVLADLSKSTANPVDIRRFDDTAQRVIDIQKSALLLFAEAMTVVGDTFAMAGYSGSGAERVEYISIKSFDEDMSDMIRERVAGLEPRSATRMGAAIRHASAQLSQRDEKTRLLLLIGDGFPNDGGYKGVYALADTHRAINEGRTKGLWVKAITVNMKNHIHLDELYGRSNHVVLSNALGLPENLVKIYASMTV